MLANVTSMADRVVNSGIGGSLLRGVVTIVGYVRIDVASTISCKVLQVSNHYCLR